MSAIPAAGNLDAAFAAIDAHWSPRVVATANGQHVKIAKAEGAFVWHAHRDEDEFFLVRKGTFVVRYRQDREVVLKEGDFHVVPRGVEHCPFTVGGEAWIILVEPVATKHTGDVVSERTRSVESQVAHFA